MSPTISLFSKTFPFKLCSCLLLLVFFFANIWSVAQDQIGGGNKKPKIKGQRDLSTDEDQSLTIYLTDLTVDDDDDGWRYPWGFTLQVYPGDNYSVSGTTITPVLNFNGRLTVPVTVSDGQAESERFNLDVNVNPVNDPPVITGQQTLSVSNTSFLLLEVAHLIISDPDDRFPDDFQLIVSEGENYTASSNRITPDAGFVGDIYVPVRVNDGQAESNVYNVVISVASGGTAPMITGQQSVSIRAGRTFTFDFSHLQVDDPDGSYPNGFSIHLQAGSNYTVAGNTITPADNFTGQLTVNVSVNDGTFESNVYPFLITVIPGDGSGAPPIIGDFEIPSGFTPNGDKVNDTWMITPIANAASYANAVVRIYSKSGQLVFESSGISEEWDGVYRGDVLPPDVYFFTVDFDSPDSKKVVKGIVTLLR